MKTILLLLLCLSALLVGQALILGSSDHSNSSSPPALVSQCVGPTAQGAATSIQCSTTMNLVAGNTLAVGVMPNAAGTVTSVCDGTGANGCTGSDTFASLTICGGNGINRVQWWYAKNIASNATATITVTFGASYLFRGIWATQWSGLNASSPLDAGPACATSAGSTTPTTATFTTANANEVLLTFVGVGSTTVGYTAGSGYTLGTACPDQDCQGQYQIVSSIQTGVTAGFTISPSNKWNISQMTLSQ